MDSRETARTNGSPDGDPRWDEQEGLRRDGAPKHVTSCWGRLFLLLALFGLGLGSARPASAGLAVMGPISPENGFPVFYQDELGLALKLCTLGDGATGPCIFDPVDPTNQWSVQTGFGEEAFWFVADSLIDLPSGGGAVLVLAVEAAYGIGAPLAGDQFAFARVRIRIDAPLDGSYKVIHPYGSEAFMVEGGIRTINFTRDIGTFAPDLSGPLRGDIGPFLVSTSYKSGDAFIGSPDFPQTVTGSPTGNNFFRIEGPPGAFPSAILDGLGAVIGSYIETDQFTLSGEVFDGQLPTVAAINRATYSVNPLTGVVSVGVYATSNPTALLTASVGTQTETMVGDGSGKFVAHISLAPGTPPPAQVSVTADNSKADSGALPTTLLSSLTDLVIMETPIFDLGSGSLLVSATSTDGSGAPVLTAEGLGTISGGSVLALGLIVPPAAVTVHSTAGGSDTEPVLLANLSGNAAPVALDDAAATDSTAFDPSVIIDVIANDIDPDTIGVPPAGIDPTSVVIVDPPATGTVVVNGDGTVTYTSAFGTIGPVTFSYLVRDTQGAVSNVATVLVMVTGANDAPIAFSDFASLTVDTSVVIDVLANDIDPQDNLHIVPATVSIVGLPNFGIATVNPADGSITYTPNLGFTGGDSLTYTVEDIFGAVSNLGQVNIQVMPVVTETVLVGKLQYEPQKIQWNIDGFIVPAVPGTTVEATLISGGIEISLGSVTEDPVNGHFRFPHTLAAPAQAGDQVRIVSSNGGSVLLTVDIK